LNSLKTVLL